jgi:hypothetical protein
MFAFIFKYHVTVQARSLKPLIGSQAHKGGMLPQGQGGSKELGLRAEQVD